MLPDRGGRPLQYQPLNYRHTECVCFSVTLNIAQSIVIHSVPTDETVIAMYYYSLSEIAALIIKQKTLLLISLSEGETEEGVYSFQCLNDFVSQPLVGFYCCRDWHVRYLKKTGQLHIFDLVDAE